jgi:hypothetical protein
LPPNHFVLYLDENIHNCRSILSALGEAKIAYERHGSHFPSGTPDEEWLPLVGREGWLLITVDKRIRYNELERRAVIRHRVREFVFTSGNLSGAAMARLLVIAYPEIVRTCEHNSPPFIASITKSGLVHLRFDKLGPVHGRRRRPE